MQSTYNVGLAFDQYNPAVENAMFRDLLDLQEQCRKSRSKLQVICTSDAPDRMLQSLGITRLSLTQLATLWILYYVKEEVMAPEHAEKEVIRDLRQELAVTELNPKNGNLYEFPEMYRENLFNQFDKPPPANNGNIPVDPIVSLLFG